MLMGVTHFARSTMTLNIYVNTFYPYVNSLENTIAKFLNTIFSCKTLGNKVSIIFCFLNKLK